MRNCRLHGKRRAFHLHHACLRGPIRVDDIVFVKADEVFASGGCWVPDFDSDEVNETWKLGWAPEKMRQLRVPHSDQSRGRYNSDRLTMAHPINALLSAKTPVHSAAEVSLRQFLVLLTGKQN